MPPVDLLEHFATPADATVLEGFVKVKLVHGRGTTVLLPDLLIVEGEDFRWARPLFFSACLLSHLDGAASARLGFEPTPGCQLRVGITRDRFVRSYDDGSLLYRCRITGPGRVEPGTWPTCTIDQEHVIWLDLYHHTHEAAQAAIRSSQHFRGSRWNVQGTKQLAKVEYVYFTDLRAIRSDEDLKCIAMASDGRLFLRPTNATRRDEEIAIEVYRASTLDRRHTLRIQVPAHLVASQHVWRHDAHDQPVYFEAAHQKIFRVGIESGTLLHFERDKITVATASPKYFDYAVLGYAVTVEGLIAPFDEEDTRELFKVERCSDLFAFWTSHPNEDLYTPNRVDLQAFAKPPQTPS